jgi:putative N-acetylmannosamine-6-phosphate epimerase
VELMHKDVSLAAEMAGAELQHMKILGETLAAYADATTRWPAEDFSGVTHVIEQRFGVSVSRKPATP